MAKKGIGVSSWYCLTGHGDRSTFQVVTGSANRCEPGWWILFSPISGFRGLNRDVRVSADWIGMFGFPRTERVIFGWLQCTGNFRVFLCIIEIVYRFKTTSCSGSRLRLKTFHLVLASVLLYIAVSFWYRKAVARSFCYSISFLCWPLQMAVLILMATL